MGLFFGSLNADPESAPAEFLRVTSAPAAIKIAEAAKLRPRRLQISGVLPLKFLGLGRKKLRILIYPDASKKRWTHQFENQQITVSYFNIAMENHHVLMEKLTINCHFQ